MSISVTNDVLRHCPACLELSEVYFQLSPEERETLTFWFGLSVITLLLAGLTMVSLASLTVGGGLWSHRWLPVLVGWAAMLSLWFTDPHGALWLTAVVAVYRNMCRD